MTTKTAQQNSEMIHALSRLANVLFVILFILGSFLLSSCTSHIKSADGAYYIELNNEYNQENFLPMLRVDGLLFSDGHFIPSIKSKQEMRKINRKYDRAAASYSVRGFATPEYFEFRSNYTPTKRSFVFTNAVVQVMSARDDEVIPVHVDMEIVLYPPLAHDHDELPSDPSIPYFPGWMKRHAAWLCTHIYDISACSDADIDNLNIQYSQLLTEGYQSGDIVDERYREILLQMEKPFDKDEKETLVYSDTRFPYEYALYLQSKGNENAMEFMQNLIKKYPSARGRIENKNKIPYARF